MTKQVLIIDDDYKFRGSVTAAFDKTEYSFLEAGSVNEGIEKINANPQIRVIILDLSIPPGKGEEVLSSIREKNIPGYYRVIISTAHEELLAANIAREYNVFNYLPKTTVFSTQSIRFSVEQAFKDIEQETLNTRIDKLLAIQSWITSAEPLDSILNLITRSAGELICAYTCHIRLYDFNKGDFALASFWSKVASMSEALRVIFSKPREPGKPFSGLVTRGNLPWACNDLQNNSDFIKFKQDLLETKGASEDVRQYLNYVQSTYIAPISTTMFGNAVDAVLNFSSEKKGYFTEDKINLINDIVSQTGLAIAKYWLQEKKQSVHEDYNQISDMLNEVSAKLTSNPSRHPSDTFDRIFDVVTSRISKIVRPEVTSILLFNKATGLLENVAEYQLGGRIKPFEENYKPGQSLAGSVFDSGRTIWLPNPRKQMNPRDDKRYDKGVDPYLKNIPSGKLKHYLGVPIKIGNKKLGVLRAMNKTSDYYDLENSKHNELCLLERGFSEDCRNILEIAASHLAIAIRNAQLFNRLNKNVEQLATLNSVGQHVSSEMKIKDLLKVIIEETAQVMQAEICLLFLRHASEEKIVLSEHDGITGIEGWFYDIGDGVTGEVAQTGVARLIQETDRNNGKYDKQILEFLCEKHGKDASIESLMVVPIVAKGKILGAIKVINKLGDHFKYNDDDLKLFKVFASTVGAAVENAQIYDLANQRLAIAERNAKLSDLVRAVAHEINNTGGLVPVNVQAIRDKLPPHDPSIDEMLNTIEDASMQAVEFANEIAGFSANRIGQREDLDVNELLKKAIEQTIPAVSKLPNFNNIKLDCDFDKNPVICNIYERPFIQVVRNIIINAFQAMAKTEKGYLKISTRIDDTSGGARVEFEDNGPGIAVKNLDRIFDADFTTKKGGNGLGLWLSKNHMDQIEGTIAVKSEIGLGTTFALTLPASPLAQ